MPEEKNMIHLNVELNQSEIIVDETGHVVITNPEIAEAVDQVLKNKAQVDAQGLGLGCDCPPSVNIPCNHTVASCSVDASCSVKP